MSSDDFLNVDYYGFLCLNLWRKPPLGITSRETAFASTDLYTVWLLVTRLPLLYSFLLFYFCLMGFSLSSL